MTLVRVVAAVVHRGDTLLVGRRPSEKRHGGMWEFPGGKIDPGETPEAAARRELAEELELSVTAVGSILHAVQDGASPFVIEFYPVEADGDPIAHEHSQLAWLTPEEMASISLAPADEAFVAWYVAAEEARRNATSARQDSESARLENERR